MFKFGIYFKGGEKNNKSWEQEREREHSSRHSSFILIQSAINATRFNIVWHVELQESRFGKSTFTFFADTLARYCQNDDHAQSS